jgi:WS/DGAT/MGAT family acyltransferase
MPVADVAWLRMDRRTNVMVVHVVLSFDTPVEWDRLKEICRERLVERFPRFSQRVVESRVPWRPVAWEDDPSFDLERHFHRVALPAPGDREALLELVADLMATPLDGDRPRWEMHLVEGYGPGCAIVSRVHHCIADGVALARVMLSLTDDAPDGAGDPAPPRHEIRPRAEEPRQLRQRMRAAHGYARVLAKSVRAGPDADTRLKGVLGVAQRAAATRPIPLADVKRTGRATGTTVNDVVLSAVTGALSSYLRARGSTVAEIRASVPVSLRPLDEPVPRRLGNRFGLTLLSLPLGLHDPRERLAEVHRRMAEIKNSPEGAASFGVLSVAGTMPLGIARRIIEVWTAKASAVMSNVPGPPRLVYVAGTPVTGMLAWAPKPGSISMSVTIMSYAGEITVNVAVDAGLIPDPERMVALVEDELAELQRVSAEPVSRRASPSPPPSR